MIARHLLITGRVQGVCFRVTTRTEAHKLGVKGWVRNLADGRVEAVVQGPVDAVEQLVSWCRRGPPMGLVAEVAETTIEPDQQLTQFELRY